MKLLLDAHISRSLRDYLVAAGHDCVHAGELPPATSDPELLQLALREDRVIVTADKDFGNLIFLRRLPAVGVVLLRLTLATEQERLKRFQDAWPHVENLVPGYFLVVTDRRIRRSPLPA